MELSTREKRIISTDGEIILKHLYKPANILYKIQFDKLKKDNQSYNSAVFNLSCIGYIKTDFSNGVEIEINVIGAEAAQQLIKDDKRYYLPIKISVVALILSIIAIIVAVKYGVAISL